MTEAFSMSSTELNVLSRNPLCAEAPLSLLDTWVTPTNRFFIRNHFSIPSLDISSWSLTVEGEVERPVFLSYEELQQLPSKELVCVLECAGNSRATVQPPKKVSFGTMAGWVMPAGEECPCVPCWSKWV